jgi:hypothetical protein
MVSSFTDLATITDVDSVQYSILPLRENRPVGSRIVVLPA